MSNKDHYTPEQGSFQEGKSPEVNGFKAPEPLDWYPDRNGSSAIADPYDLKVRKAKDGWTWSITDQDTRERTPAVRSFPTEAEARAAAEAALTGLTSREPEPQKPSPEAAPEPASLCAEVAGKQRHKSLIQNKGFKLPYNVIQQIETSPSAAETRKPPPPVIIGFDVEWFTDPSAPDHNIILSYQYAGRTDIAEWSGIVYTRAARTIMHPDLSDNDLCNIPERTSLRNLIGRAIAEGVKLGKLRKWPKQVIAAAHWTRADLAAMTDFPKFKYIFAGVHKTYVSLNGKGYKASFTNNGHTHKFNIILADTMLLAPGGERSLKALAPLYDEQKLDPGVAPDGARYIEHMDRLLVDNPELFKAYAIKDAEICAKHTAAIIDFVNGKLGLNVKRPPVTIGSIAVKYTLKRWEEKGIKLDEINGVISCRKEQAFNKTSSKYITKKIIKNHTKYTLHEDLAKSCYFGGRNECFHYGPTSNMQDPRGAVYTPVDGIPVTFREFDLKAAYATAMTTLQIPDYEAARFTTNPADFRPDELGFALLQFQFPATTRFPCLPVVSANEHGLIYPLCGETYATAPEIALAVHLGAEIKIVHGVVIPWVVNSPHPFAMVIQEFADRRREHPEGTVANALFKLLGNSLYGKLGQGLKDKTAYDTAEMHLKPIPPSDITNPYLVAHITGLVRALISEIVASISDRWTVVYLATDGFITNAPLAELSMEGPVARHLAQARARMDGPVLLDQKFEVDQLLAWRTRGVATLQAKGKPKLAKGGMRAPEGVEDWNQWFVKAMLDREPKQTYTSREPLSFPEAHRTNADHITRVREKRMNFEFDFKRRPVDPIELNVRGRRHLSLTTVPWQTVEEFNETRALFERWHQQGNCLKNMQDWRRWEAFQEGTVASKAGVSRRAKGGLVGQALRLFRRAYVRSKWGLPGRRYEVAAQALTKAGYRTTEQDFKNALRLKNAIPEHTISAAAVGIRELIIALVKLWPEFEWQKLVREPWEGYLQTTSPLAAGPATFAPELAGETPLRGAETLEGFKFAYDIIQRNETLETRTPEEVAENDALCDWFFGPRDPEPPHMLPDPLEEPGFRLVGRLIPHLARRIPRPLSFATMLREDEGEGVLLTELVCQSDWGPTDMQPQPAVR